MTPLGELAKRLAVANPEKFRNARVYPYKDLWRLWDVSRGIGWYSDGRLQDTCAISGHGSSENFAFWGPIWECLPSQVQVTKGGQLYERRAGSLIDMVTQIVQYFEWGNQ